MTHNQIAYQEHMERKRNNAAVEAETHRANVERENENKRHNLATETETHRSNTVYEGIEQSKLGEMIRSNMAKEQIQRWSAQKQYEVGMANAAASRYAADRGAQASMYSADRRYEGSKYSADSSKSSNKYSTDRNVDSANLDRHYKYDQLNLDKEKFDRHKVDKNTEHVLNGIKTGIYGIDVFGKVINNGIRNATDLLQTIGGN